MKISIMVMIEERLDLPSALGIERGRQSQVWAAKVPSLGEAVYLSNI